MLEIDVTPAAEGDQLDPLALIGLRMRKTAADLVAQRAPIEQRWIDDLRQYHGRYKTEQEASQKKSKRSKAFNNVTRPKTNAWIAQMCDMLFPNDDKNYGIGPTPVPELSKKFDDETPATINGEQYQGPDGAPITEGMIARRTMEIAKEKAEAMEREIDDQLVECDYNAQARVALRYAGILGTGVLCGPEVDVVTEKAWVEAGAGYQLEIRTKRTPIVRAVMPWDFFPDLSARTLAEAEYVFERSYMTERQLRALSKRFSPAQVAKALAVGPKTSQFHSPHLDELRQLSGLTNSIDDNRFEVWTYRGPVEKEALIALGADLDPDDPLQSLDGVVVFCGAVVLHATVNPLDSGEWPYSVFCFEQDDHCIFGYGLPYVIRSSQDVINAAWRMMLDNSAASAGPQIVRNRKLIQPADGTYDLTAFKQWDYVGTSQDNLNTAFAFFNIPNHQGEIAQVYQLARAMVDEESGLPMVAQGEQGQVTPTLGGMSMLMNAANTVRRKQVKDWDDNVTVPMIGRFYDWNMQFNPKDEVKGDFQVHARGTSALLVKETQAANIMALIDKYAGHPATANLLKVAEALRTAVQSMHLDAKALVKTDEEIEAEQQQMAEQGQQDPGAAVEQMRLQQIQMKAELEMQLEQARQQFDGAQRDQDRRLKLMLAESDLRREAMQQQTEVMKLAQTKQISTEKLTVELRKLDNQLRADLHKFNTELLVKQQAGLTANYGLDNGR